MAKTAAEVRRRTAKSDAKIIPTIIGEKHDKNTSQKN